MGTPAQAIAVGVPSPAAARRVVRSVLPWVIAAAGMAAVARDLDLHVLATQFGLLRWKWVAAAVLFDVLSYVFQGVRWSVLLRPAGGLSVARATQAIYVGLFANEVLPLRAGEVIRTLLAARWLKAGAVRVVPSILMERLLDGIWLALAVGVTAAVVPLPSLVSGAIHLLLLALGFGALVLFAIARLGHKGTRWSRVNELLDGVREIGWGSSTAIAAMVSAGVLVSQALSFWFAMLSCGMQSSLWVGAAVLFIVRLGTMVPAAPANVGTYQFFCVLGLTLFGVAKNAAAAFSVVVFMMLTVPLWAIGWLSMVRAGVTVSEFRSAREG